MKHILLLLPAMLAKAVANAQAPASGQTPVWENIAPLPNYDVEATLATASGDMYLARS